MHVRCEHANLVDLGENRWRPTGEATWGLVKYGTSFAVNIASASSSVGIGLVASAAVSGMLATLVAPVVLPFIVAGTFVGTYYASQMTISSLTEGAMDFARKKLTEVEDPGKPQVPD